MTRNQTSRPWRIQSLSASTIFFYKIPFAIRCSHAGLLSTSSNPSALTVQGFLYLLFPLPTRLFLWLSSSWLLHFLCPAYIVHTQRALPWPPISKLSSASWIGTIPHLLSPWNLPLSIIVVFISSFYFFNKTAVYHLFLVLAQNTSSSISDLSFNKQSSWPGICGIGIVRASWQVVMQCLYSLELYLSSDQVCLLITMSPVQCF